MHNFWILKYINAVSIVKLENCAWYLFPQVNTQVTITGLGAGGDIAFHLLLIAGSNDKVIAGSIFQLLVVSSFLVTSI